MASPMAGSFYRAPAPGEPAFCKEGDRVSKGQTVCIIEAMKLMNEIEVSNSSANVTRPLGKSKLSAIECSRQRASKYLSLATEFGDAVKKLYLCLWIKVSQQYAHISSGF